MAADHSVVDPAVSLQTAGLEDGDHLTAIAVEARLAATDRVFALFCCGGDRVVTWGHPDFGGDSSRAQGQLKGVQQVQATDRAFAAILSDGSVVTWGDPDYGANSSQAQDRLKVSSRFKQLAGHLLLSCQMDRLWTWGDPDCGGDSSEVQDQLKIVQQVQGTFGAFAAILAEARS